MTGVRHSPGVDLSLRPIGVFSPVVGGFYFGAVIAGITRAAHQAGRPVVAVQTYPAGLDRERYPDDPVADTPLGLAAMDGVIVVARALGKVGLDTLARWGKPVVLISEDAPGPVEWPIVAPDNDGGIRAAVDHLVAHGHERIGFAGRLIQPDLKERHAAWHRAMRAHGLVPAENWFFETTDNHSRGGADAAERMISAGLPTTAVIAATDRNAVGLVHALRTAGLSLPRDQAVIGFDHTDSGARVGPRLSTIDPHYDQVGALAVEALLTRLRDRHAVVSGRSPRATLVLRESCGCAEPSLAGAPPSGEGLTSGDTGSAHAPAARSRLRTLADTAFGGPAGLAGSGRDERERWWLATTDPLITAAQRGTAPTATLMSRLAELTSALQPHPEALEVLLPALRDLENELADAGDETAAPSSALRNATTSVVLAVTKGCTSAMLARSGHLERTVIEQYEVDLDLLRPDGPSVNTLSWLPRTLRGRACLGLWAGPASATGDRTLHIVGASDTSGRLSRLIGTETTASRFPPGVLNNQSSRTLTFVIPVTTASNDWGLLAIDGTAESHGTSPRDRFNHWAAMLAVAIEREGAVDVLRRRATELESAAGAARAAADAVRASEERYSLASLAADDGTWDWDVSSGTVYYSPRWKQLLGYADGDVGTTPSEWLSRVHPDDKAAVAAAIAAQLGGAPQAMKVEHRIRAANGRYRWMLCRAVAVIDDAGCTSRLVGSIVDVGRRKEAEDVHRSAAVHDTQTGLISEALFADRLGVAVRRARRLPRYDCAVFLLRVINNPPPGSARPPDGPPETAMTQQAILRWLRRSATETDTAARLDDNEYALLVDDVEASSRTARLTTRLAALRHTLGDQLAVGILPSVHGCESAAAALRAARAVMLHDHLAPVVSQRSAVH